MVVGFLLATFLGTPAIRGLIRYVDRSGRKPPAHPAPAEPEIDPALLGLEEAAAQMPGGEWIGWLERAATYACILSGFPGGIAMVLAVKGLGRYPELRTPNEAKGERFIVGTFASILWAAGIAGIAWGVNRLW